MGDKLTLLLKVNLKCLLHYHSLSDAINADPIRTIPAINPSIIKNEYINLLPSYYLPVPAILAPVSVLFLVVQICVSVGYSFTAANT